MQLKNIRGIEFNFTSVLAKRQRLMNFLRCFKVGRKKRFNYNIPTKYNQNKIELQKENKFTVYTTLKFLIQKYLIIFLLCSLTFSNLILIHYNTNNIKYCEKM